MSDFFMQLFILAGYLILIVVVTLLVFLGGAWLFDRVFPEKATEFFEEDEDPEVIKQIWEDNDPDGVTTPPFLIPDEDEEKDD